MKWKIVNSNLSKDKTNKKQYLQFTFIKVSSLKSIYLWNGKHCVYLYHEYFCYNNKSIQYHTIENWLTIYNYSIHFMINT